MADLNWCICGKATSHLSSDLYCSYECRESEVQGPQMCGTSNASSCQQNKRNRGSNHLVTDIDTYYVALAFNNRARSPK
ncbi:hypothetical protein HDU78_007297 [Chytriomyces hyalinus]|nr:hypothetical protein HDU78_007297 [Chytriomyces hyalinus]KAJ3265057.1 hypothetical protein HDU77_006692 [Chytriomyces hyalinus]KAJ3399813.1 hypothetical protein HDU80_007558 [Chytriomyces hyalinus]